MNGFLDYADGNSVIHRLDPRTKLFFPLIICIAAFASSNIFFLISLLLFDLLLGALGGIFRRTAKIFISLVKIMLFLFVMQVLFIQRGETIFPLLFGLRVTDDGVISALLVVLRLICATLPLSVMLSLTKLNDLSNSLVVRLRVPFKYAFALTSAIRFIPAFSSDMREIMEAQTARGVEFDTRNFAKKLKLIIPLCVPLLISSVKKADSTAIAAQMRGFNLRNRESCLFVHSYSLLDLLALVIAAGICALGFIL